MAWVGLVAVGLLAVNLRPGATSIGPVLAEIQKGVALSTTAAGLLTALPGICFAGFGAAAVWIAGRVGTAGALALGLLVAAVGIAGRSLTSNAWIFIALSALALAGAAVGNILAPAFIKRHFPNRQALMMSVYTFGLSIGATAPGLVSPLLLGSERGWRIALAIWGVTASVALVPWIWLAVRERRSGPGPRYSRSGGGILSLVRSHRAVALAIFFGVQSMQAYVTFGWLAQILRDSGASASTASLLVSWYSAFGLPAALVMPPIVARARHLEPYVVAFGLLLGGGFAGLWLAPTFAPFVWVTMTGVAGFAFPMALALITARSRDPHVTARLSAFSQSTGYVFSGLGPFLMGLLHELTGAWDVPMIVMTVSAVALVWTGLVIARPGYVDDDLAR